MIKWIGIAEIIALVAALYMYATDEMLKGIFWSVMSVAIYVLDKSIVNEDTK